MTIASPEDDRLFFLSPSRLSVPPRTVHPLSSSSADENALESDLLSYTTWRTFWKPPHPTALALDRKRGLGKVERAKCMGEGEDAAADLAGVAGVAGAEVVRAVAGIRLLDYQTTRTSCCPFC